MLPQFPVFKTLELSDRADVEQITRPFMPFSDFNFTSLWIYDTHEICRLSILNENLILCMSDYLKETEIFTIIGDKKIDQTFEVIFDYLRNHKLPTELSLVPAIVIENLKNSQLYSICEDINNFDYVLSVAEQVELQGGKFHNRRNLVKRFERDYLNKVKSEIFSLKEKSKQSHFLEALELWKISRKKSDEDVKKEEKYLERLFKAVDSANLYAVLLQDGNKPIGFSVFEPTFRSYAIIHHQKGDITYRGIFEYTLNIAAKSLEGLGCKYINYEQDLGIEGLRRAKQLLRPVSFLKKFKVKPC